MYDKCSDCEYGNVENLRLENQELKKQLDFISEQNKYIDKLEKEVKELKELNIAISKGLKKVTAKRNKWRNRYYKARRENADQQKEFMKYLNYRLKDIDFALGSYGSNEVNNEKI